MKALAEVETVAPPVHPNLVLGICCMSLLLVGMDVTIVNVALPSIQHDLHGTLSGLQWVVDAYTLVIASLLMLSGSMADRFGRRRVFQLGLVMFTGGSLLCSLAQGIPQLAAFRAIQGLGASMLNPVALSIIANTFLEPKARARAIGVWGAVAGFALALGPIVGGALTQTVGWRSVFWVNLPIGLVALVLTARYIPESKAARARALDPGGQLLIFLTLACLTSGVIEGPRAGWGSGLILALFAGACTAAVGFIAWEPRRPEPLVDLRFFGSVPFSAAAMVAVCTFASFSGFLFLNALYLQQTRGLSPLHTGLCTLPLAAMMMVCGPISGRMIGSLGTRPSLLLSGGSIAASTLMLTGLTVSTPLPYLLVCYSLFGVGLGMANPAIANTAVSGMPRAQAGVAAAIASTSRQVGAAMGVAIAGSVVHAARVGGIGFATATHPVWWGMAASGMVVMVLGWMGNTEWARSSAGRVKGLFKG